MNDSVERQLSKSIQDLTNHSLIKIHSDAARMVDMGLCADKKEALEYLLYLLSDTKEQDVECGK